MDVHSQDTLQEVNPGVYQVRRDLCAKICEPHCSNILDKLKRVCNLTLVIIDIFSGLNHPTVVTSL